MEKWIEIWLFATSIFRRSYFILVNLWSYLNSQPVIPPAHFYKYMGGGEREKMMVIYDGICSHGGRRFKDKRLS